MNELDKYSPIELQKMGNDIKKQYDTLQREVINHTYEIEELEKILNTKVKILQELEHKYIMIIEKLVE